jgi:hypothetical protein
MLGESEKLSAFYANKFRVNEDDSRIYQKIM